jgi:competence protein ComEC
MATALPTPVKRSATAPERPRFVAWSLPAALLLLGGIGLNLLHLSPLIMVLLSALVVGLSLLMGWRSLLLLTLFMPLGYLRFELWARQTNPLSVQLGQHVTLSGVSDGQYLTLDDPKGVRVVLSPRGRVGAGRVVVSGELALPQGKRNPGGFDYRGYLRRRGVWAQLFVREIDSFTPSPPSARDRLQRGVTANLSPQAAALVQAMALGIRDDLGELRDVFSASGLAHILALSGLHVGILVAALGLLLTPLGRQRFPLLIAFVWLFVLLVGPTPSILRAASMASAVLLSLYFGAGRIAAWPSLALSVIIVLLYNPAFIQDISFQLSYLAVIGLLLIAPPLTRRLLGEAKLPRWHWRSLTVGGVAISLSAQLTTLPLIASSFGALPLFSPLLNVLGIPLATLLVPMGFLAGVVGVVSLPLAARINQMTQLLASWLIGLAELGASFPALIWGEVSWMGYLYFYLGLSALIFWLWGRLKLWRALVVVICASLLSAFSLPPHPAPEIIYFDVGQGDSSLIRLPGHREILIDGGGSPFSDFDVGGRIVVPALKALGVSSLELVIATHPDTDHIEGLLAVLEQLPVGTLIIGHPEPGNPLFERLMAVAERRRVPVREVRRGETLLLGDARLEILNPPFVPYDNANDNSVAFTFYWQNEAIATFLGDLSIAAERGIAFAPTPILMAAHHGSGSSTSAALLAAVSPEVVVLSYGRNTYGHPHWSVLERIAAVGAKVRATHEEGAVRIPFGR